MRHRSWLWWAGTIAGGAFGALFGYVVGEEYGGVMGSIAGFILGIPFGAFIGPYLAIVLAAAGTVVVAPLMLLGLLLYVIWLAIQDLLGRLR